jgi:hypothetical protein
MLSHRSTTALLALFLSAITSIARAESAMATGDCTDLRGTESIFAGHRIVMVGETHGTNEMPAMFTRLVCAALRRGQVVSVGLELPSNQRELLDAYMASGGGETARKTLLASAFWTAQFQDGRRSGAYFDMVEAFRAMRGRGLSLTVFILEEQATAASDSLSRDELMAANVKRKYQTQPDTLVLTFTGNIHNMLKIPERLPNIPTPMGAWLRGLNPVSINLTGTGGTAWDCRPQCGVHGNPPGAAPRPVAEPVLTLGADEGEYSGHLDIGYTSASPPAAKLYQ